MPKARWGVSGSAVDAVEVEQRERFTPYDGPIPPKYSILDCEVKRCRVKEFSSGNSGLDLVLIANGEGSKSAKKYKGLPLFENIVDLPQNDWKIRQWLDAIGATGKDWDNTVIDAEKNVTKFGRVAVEGLIVRVSTAMGTNQAGDPRAEVGEFISLSEIEDGDADADEGDGDGDSSNTPF